MILKRRWHKRAPQSARNVFPPSGNCHPHHHHRVPNRSSPDIPEHNRLHTRPSSCKSEEQIYQHSRLDWWGDGQEELIIPLCVCKEEVCVHFLGFLLLPAEVLFLENVLQHLAKLWKETIGRNYGNKLFHPHELILVYYCTRHRFCTHAQKHLGGLEFGTMLGELLFQQIVYLNS